jgi:carbon-monoxide dehydrogenase medium subunit
VNDFDYAAPASVEEALQLMQQHPEGKLLAGGMSLLSAMKLRVNQPSHLIDLRRIGSLRGIRREGNELVIGAMTRHAEVAASRDIRTAIPALADLAGGIGDRQVRNRGTIGGSVANNDPAACYPAGLVGLGATVVTTGGSVQADQFFTGLFETALAPGDLVTEVRFPIPRRAAYVKFSQPASRFAVVGVMVSQAADGKWRVGVTGARTSAYRERAIEAALAAGADTAAVRRLQLADDGGYNDDLHASAAYRRSLVVEVAARAIAKSKSQS